MSSVFWCAAHSSFFYVFRFSSANPRGGGGPLWPAPIHVESQEDVFVGRLLRRAHEGVGAAAPPRILREDAFGGGLLRRAHEGVGAAAPLFLLREAAPGWGLLYDPILKALVSVL